MSASLDMETGLVKLSIRGSSGTAAVLLIGGVEGIRVVVSPDGRVLAKEEIRDPRVSEAFSSLAENLQVIVDFYNPCLVLEEQAFALAEEIFNAERGLTQLPPGTTVASLSKKIEEIQSKLNETNCSPAPRPVPGCNTGLEMQYQQMYNWCWIATATSISLFYDPASTWTQCSLIGAVLQLQCCPPTSVTANPYDPASLYDLENVVANPICDHSGGVGDSLAKTGNFRQGIGGPIPLLSSPSGPPSVMDEMCAGTPIIATISWTGSILSHDVAIAGVNGELLHIHDPIFGEQDIYYEVFPANYQSGGTWTYSVLTQPA